MSSQFLLQACIYLLAAVLLVPLAKRLGLSSIIGYLIAGVAIGPFALGFIGSESKDILHVAEFGVVMMLFLIGLELEPAHFWRMRKMILGFGLSQMVFTTLLLWAFFFLVPLSWRAGLTLAMAFAMSSTAIVLQTLKEKGLSQSSMGQASFSVLLFQDIAIIPILALLPLLSEVHEVPLEAHEAHLLDELPAFLQSLAVVGSVGIIYLVGRFLIAPLLYLVSRTRLQELFTATALLVVVSVAYLMSLVGLSAALGAFLAGVMLAGSEFKHELEIHISPFKGLLLGLFFIGVGASIDFNLLLASPLFILAMVLGVITAKLVLLFLIGRFFKMALNQSLLFAFGLSQVGEFAFILFGFAEQLQIFEEQFSNQMVAVTALSMMISPFLILLHEKLIEPYFGTKVRQQAPEADAIEARHPVIIAGFGHFGSTVGRLLRANGVEATILDNDSDRVDLLRKMGFQVYYGDASRLDLLEVAGAEEAKILIIALDNPILVQEMVEEVKKRFPHLQIFTRAKNRTDAYELLDLQVQQVQVYRESLHTAVQLGVDVLVQLGKRRYTATRQGQKFIQYDEAALLHLKEMRHNQKDYVVRVREQIENQEELLRKDVQEISKQQDRAWDSEPLKQSARGSS